MRRQSVEEWAHELRILLEQAFDDGVTLEADNKCAGCCSNVSFSLFKIGEGYSEDIG